MALAMLLIAGAFFVYQAPFVSRLIDTYTLTADVDAEIARLSLQTPELFTKSYGGVSKTELRGRIESSLRNRNLLVKEARRRRVADVSDEVATSYAAIAAQYTNTSIFKQYLQDKGTSEKQFRKALEANLLIAALAKSLVMESDISSEQVRAYYEANRSRYQSVPTKRASHILFAAGDSATADIAYKKIAGGADFAALARQYSKDSESGKRGGDIGYSTSTYPASFQAAVDSLKVGEVSQPVTTQYGIHLIKVTEVNEGTQSFEEVKDKVRADLLGKLRAEAIDKLLVELKG